MSNEIVVGSHVLTGTESLFATLTTWHDFVDVYVDGSLDAAIPNSQWNVYAVTAGTRTQIAGGTFQGDPTNGQRVLANVPGKGTTIELWARSVNGVSGGALKAAIVGWSLDTATTNPDDAVDASVTLTNNTPVAVCTGLVWHPIVTAFVQAGPAALNTMWTIRAAIAGLTSKIPVASAQFLDVVASRNVVQASGGTTTWELWAQSPVGNSGSCAASLFGQSGIEAVLVPTASAVILSGLDTTGITDGDFVYISAAETVSKTDAGNAAKSRCIGASIGAAGSIVLDGAIVDAKFTIAGGAPSAGAPVYLAAASDDGATGAGKLTATAPSVVGQNVVAVGICYDAANYAGSKTSKVALQLEQFAPVDPANGNVFVYRPGGTAGTNVFTTFAAAYAAAFALGVPCAIAIDDSLGAAVTGAAGALDLSQIDLVNLKYNTTGTAPHLTFQTGTTVTNFRRITNVWVTSTSTSSICTISSGFHEVVCSEQGFLESTTAPFFHVLTGATLFAYLNSFTLSNNTSQVISVDAGGSGAVLALTGVCAIGSTTLAGAGTVSASSASASSTLPTTMAGVTGTYAVTNATLCKNIKYTDVAPLLVPTPALGTGKATAQEAIDGLKASRTFTYQPGGVAGNGLYTDWATLVAAMNLVGGVRYLYVDSSLSPVGSSGLPSAPIPVGVWDLNPTIGTGLVWIVGKTGVLGPVADFMILETAVGAVSLAGVSRVNNITINNRSSIDFMTLAGCHNNLVVEGKGMCSQDVAATAAFVKCATTGEIYVINNSSFGCLNSNGGTDAIQVDAAGKFVSLSLEDLGGVADNMVKYTAGSLTILCSATANYSPQADATTRSASTCTTSGTTVLVNGQTAAISCNITASSRIFFNVITPISSNGTGKIAAFPADRTNGPIGTGSFKITACIIAGDTINVADQSTLSWMVVN